MRASNDYVKICLYVAVLFIFLFVGLPAKAADRDNCLLCHRYRFLGRIDENGRRINYNVNEHVYSKTVHYNVPCRDCHTYIDKLPHAPVTEEVNCANVCHIKPPFANENFSHEKIIKIYSESAHAIKPDDSPDLKEAKPYCKFCHINPVYTRVDEKRIAFEKTLQRCLNCHREKGVTLAYIHVTHRLRHKTSRSPQEIVRLCAKCHADEALMKKLNVSEEGQTAVETYLRSIHGKSVILGSQSAADCITCHASSKLHDIYKKDDKKASIYKDNILQTCKQCHERTNKWLVQIGVHPKAHDEAHPVIHFTSVFFTFALYGAVFSLMGLLLLETRSRKKDGIKFLLRHGTSWRGKLKRRIKK